MSDNNNPKERTLRVPVAATVSRPYWRGGPWTAEAGRFSSGTHGRWQAEAASEKAAVDTLTAGLREFVAQYREPSVFTFRGYVAVVSIEAGDSYAPVNWRQQVIEPDGRAQCGSTCRQEGWGEAEAYAKWNLAQLATDWHDDACVHAGAAYLAGCEQYGYGQYGPQEFYRYAAWQRAWKVAHAAGLGDGCHRWAGDHWAEFAVPRPDSAGAQ